MPLAGMVKNIIGVRHGRLVVTAYSDFRKGDHWWQAVCDCGNTVVVVGYALRNGNTMSCGCYRSELMRKAKTKHGMSTSDEYKIWCGINNRCLNKNSISYKNYGGRGIVVCDRWRRGNENAFMNFLADMGARPSRLHSIDRKDVDGNYCKENCRWATQKEQQRNRRSNAFLEHDGKKMTLGEWAEELGISPATIRTRLYRGWDLAHALSTPSPVMVKASTLPQASA